MKNITVFIVIVLLLKFSAFAQNPHKSIHQLELEKYDKLNFNTEEQWDEYNGIVDLPEKNVEDTSTLNHIVFGWHPYWMGTAYNNYQWDKLSDLAYFGYEVDYTTGNDETTHGFEYAPVVDTALSKGVRVHLTTILFGNFDAFFADSAAQSNLITNLVTQVISRGIVGINIDFEGMGGDNRAQFTNFIHNLSTELHTQVSGSILSICLYAVDWSGVFDIPALVDDVDLFTIMGYAYYYSGSSEAGPTGQLYTMNGFNFTQTRSIEYYLYKGVPLEKLVLGVPYFGYDWPTASTSIPSSTTASGTAKTIAQVKQNSSGYYSNSFIEPYSLAKYYIYDVSGQTHQCWIDDEETMKYMYKAVLQTGIAGIAIWALGYDNGSTEMWDLIGNYFSDSYVQPSSDTIWDLGGPLRSYFNNEDYTFTISPEGATSFYLYFPEFDVETDYDYLYIYDGPSIASTLLGTYTGTNSPGVIISSVNALTLRFTSDGATVNPGFTAIWSTQPVTLKENSEFVKSDFTVFPNVANDFIKIFKTTQVHEADFSLYNTAGQMVFRNNLTENVTEINISSFPAGTYIYNILQNGKQVESGKVVIKK